MAKSKRKICLIICEIKEKGSKERKHANFVLKNIIEPALRIRGIEYKAVRIDKLGEGGYITEAVIEHLRTADLVIADLTNLNPNVMYELGIRQAWNLPLVPIALKKQKLPFDLVVLRTAFYKLPIAKKSIDEAKKEIRKQILSILKGEYKNVIFERAISIIGKSYSMDAVYEAFKDALNDMHESLEDCKHDLSYTDTWQNKNVLLDLARKITGIAKTMSDKTHAFKTIARGHVYDPDSSDKYLISLIDRVDGIQHNINTIVRLLNQGKPIKIKQRKHKIQSKIQLIIQRIEQIALKCKTKDK